MVPLLDERLWFPDPCQARRDGLVAVGGDLSVSRLLLAYRSGLFPWTVDPITWWSPEPRAIFEFDRFHIPRSLGRVLRHPRFQVTFDSDFHRVIEECAVVPRRDGATWISPEFIQAYGALFEAGHAHSVECWQQGRLVGGIYGVSIGGFFAGESMFHLVDDASKVALVHLCEELRRRNYSLFDTQMITPTTRLFGAVEISRPEYLRRLFAAVQSPERWERPVVRR
jgi:leucyl/phenylalanyl-tRNA--protein transferase